MANEVARKPVITISARSMIRKLPVALFIYYVLGVICGYFSSLYWLFDLCSHFRLQQFWLGLGFTITFILIRMRRLAVVSAGIAVLIGVQSLLPWYIPRQVAAADFKTVRFLYANVWLRNTNHQAVIELIKEEDPDVIVGQEITSDWMNALRILKNEYPYGIDIPIDSPQGVTVISRIPMAKAEDVRIESFMGPVIRAVMKVDGKEVEFVTAHLAAPKYRKDIELRDEQMRMLADYLAGLGSPKILIGDLNCSMWSEGYDPIEEVPGMVNARKGFGILGTWPTMRYFPGVPIDHCLVSREIGVKSVRVGPDIGSDHYPMIFDLEIPLSGRI